MMGPIGEVVCTKCVSLKFIDWEYIQEAGVVVVLSSLNRSLPWTEYFMSYFHIR